VWVTGPTTTSSMRTARCTPDRCPATECRCRLAARNDRAAAAILLTYCGLTSRMVATSTVEIPCVSTSEREVSRAKRPVAVSSSRCRRCCTSWAGGSRPGVGREQEPGAAQRLADVQRFSRPCHTRRPIPAVITMRKSSKLPLVWLVHTSEKRYQTGRIVAGDHKSGHENNPPHANWWGYPQMEWTS
jgi:hypothetical protein